MQLRRTLLARINPFVRAAFEATPRDGLEAFQAEEHRHPVFLLHADSTREILIYSVASTTDAGENTATAMVPQLRHLFNKTSPTVALLPTAPACVRCNAWASPSPS